MSHLLSFAHRIDENLFQNVSTPVIHNDIIETSVIIVVLREYRQYHCDWCLKRQAMSTNKC